ncbi:lactoylglutathione lyase-like protein [Abortiporus biennis]|nr:lactoylglutathione lyase-like protein [Abortiporus biennis]
MPINHILYTVKNVAATKKFFLQALAPLGYTEYYNVEGVITGLKDSKGLADLWFQAAKKPEDKLTTGLHYCFSAESREVVDKFYEAALAAGATDNGAPGIRSYGPTYYAAFVIDLDGNNVEVAHI